MAALWNVEVPFEPFVHASLDSTIQAALPEASLESGVRIIRTDPTYVASVEVEATTPRAARAAGVDRVESFLKVLAAWNDGFTVEMSRVRATATTSSDGTATVEVTETGANVAVRDTVFVEEHIGIVKSRHALTTEDAVLGRIGELPPFVRNCLDLNYLLVISDRPPIRWLLAATGLEALAVGRLRDQPRLEGLISVDTKSELESKVDTALMEAGIESAEKRKRGIQRLVETTLESVAAHVVRYLKNTGVDDVSVDDIARWWRTRSQIAHGSGARLDLADLNRLITCFQMALRRELGLEGEFGQANGQ
jgi:hypothetical protein